MKFAPFYAALLGLLLPFTALSQGVGIGTTAPNASAALDVSSTTAGLLLPRLSSLQRVGIASPAAGLLVFQTDNTPGVYYYNGTAWLNLTTGTAPATTGVASTLAGSGTGGFADGAGAAAQFSNPLGVACDGSGRVYVADYGNQRIRAIVVATGAVSTLAGSGAQGYAEGTGVAAQFSNPRSVACDGSGNVYVSDTNNHRIRVIVAATGVVSTLAGSGTPGYADGVGAAAQFNSPGGVACDGSGRVYVSDTNNQRIRVIVAATGVVSTLAGSGSSGYAEGTGAAAQFSSPYGIACDGSGRVYVADYGNQRIRAIVVATGAVSTLAGSGTYGYAEGTGAAAQFSNPLGVACDGSGHVYVADPNNHRIRAIVAATGVVSTLAGSTSGYADGVGAAAQFNSPIGVACDGSGHVYVADTSNQRIRAVR